MSKAVRGDGEAKAEFDRRMEAFLELEGEEALSELRKLCDWVHSYPKVRRNLDGPRYNMLLLLREYCPEHGVWPKVDEFIRIRQTQNSIAAKFKIKEQREHGQDQEWQREQSPNTTTNN